MDVAQACDDFEQMINHGEPHLRNQVSERQAKLDGAS
jgi:hypothetical protein